MLPAKVLQSSLSNHTSYHVQKQLVQLTRQSSHVILESVVLGQPILGISHVTDTQTNQFNTYM